MSSSVVRFWTRSYAPDYVGFAILAAAYTLIALFVTPFHRLFFINDLAISFPHAEVERVPVLWNIIYAGLLPILLATALNILTRASPHKHHVTLLGLLIALILTSFITDIVKNTVGRPRPDLIARCKPAPGTTINTLVGIDVCTETRAHVLHDGWRSFPSGHSSFSFAGLGYLSLFLAGQVRLFVVGRYHVEERERGGGILRSGGNARGGHDGSGNNNNDNDDEQEHAVYARGDLARALLCLAPLLGAAMIAISRCQDYRHDVYDVCTGALLGYVVAYWSYRRYWPGLASWHCDEPYPGPSYDVGGPLYGALRDEEEGRGRGQNNVGYEMDVLPS
ncbi:phosphatidic acid phosphatase type 2/haloperoxidase [Coniella lustricola]|uniref:Phosphatidic acid phosphatase type 2/haloperoxidase n=1 Tax=Coniella lustricola TaxID=2025994 RepID=A0A2T2ZW82_9PEZI|nr:phosphatidic acid phosphatase type 2/haloperoxidase [Coniella lustricola]